MGMGSIHQNLFISDHGHVAYQVKGNQETQQHGSKYFTCRHAPTDLGLELQCLLKANEDLS